MESAHYPVSNNEQKSLKSISVGSSFIIQPKCSRISSLRKLLTKTRLEQLVVDAMQVDDIVIDAIAVAVLDELTTCSYFSLEE